VLPLELPGRVQVRDNLGPPPEDPANIELVRRLVSSIESGAPGVRAAAVTWAPLSSSYNTTRVVDVDGRPVSADDGGELEVSLQSVTPSYREVMGIPMVRGRWLAESDAAGAPLAVVVSAEAARRLWPELESPVGRRLVIDPYGANRPKPADAAARPPAGPQILELAVVGVARDVRASGADTRPRPELYVSYWQVPWQVLEVIVHAPPSAGLTAEKLRGAVAALDATVPGGDITTLESIAGASVAQPRYEMTLMALFGVLAAALALIGCYGVMAYAVSQRTREIGVRMALGASRESVTAEVLGESARAVGWGLLAGLILSAASTRVLERSLYGVSATDPLTFVLAACALAGATLLAAWLPARRAAAVEPARTLRED
jgi:predicted permease